MLKLIPRINYKFSITDAIIAFRGLLSGKHKYTRIEHLFDNESLRFFNHARTALIIGLQSLGLPEGSKIGVQILNCYTVFKSISLAGYTPVFIDITENFQMDIEDLRKKSMGLDALIITHSFGFPNPIDEIKMVTGKIPIIEDCAHSFYSKYKGKYTGTWGSLSIFSIGKGKFPAVGEGGILLVNDRKLLDKIDAEYYNLKKRKLYEEIWYVFYSLFLSILHSPIIYGAITRKYIKQKKNQSPVINNYSFDNKKMLKVVSIVFENRQKNISCLKENQKRNAQLYLEKFQDLIENAPPFNINNDPNFFMLPLKLKTDRTSHIRMIKQKGLEVDHHFKQSLNWASLFNYKENECPKYEAISKHLIMVPTYIDSQKFRKIID